MREISPLGTTAALNRKKKTTILTHKASVHCDKHISGNAKEERGKNSQPCSQVRAESGERGALLTAQLFTWIKDIGKAHRAYSLSKHIGSSQ